MDLHRPRTSSRNIAHQATRPAQEVREGFVWAAIVCERTRFFAWSAALSYCKNTIPVV